MPRLRDRRGREAEGRRLEPRVSPPEATASKLSGKTDPVGPVAADVAVIACGVQLASADRAVPGDVAASTSLVRWINSCTKSQSKNRVLSGR